MKKAALCLVAIATLAFCADIDKNLLTGKTWKCSQEIENISGHSISEDHSVQFDKNGSYTWSVTTRYIEPKNRFAINFIESGEW
ncbi:MAG: hypothetical protein LBO72_03665, partial [Helicobacteraceae bacterium]|nr:hypothetical protein [Helicobacteraceae bacterium]